MLTHKLTLALAAAVSLVTGCTDNQFGNNPMSGANQAAANPLNVSTGITWNASQMPSPGVLLMDDSMLAMLGQWERQELGVTPMTGLQSANMNAPTPASIQGGQVITTQGLVSLLAQSGVGPVLVLDILGGPQRIPGAQYALPAAQGGAFDDRTQQQFAEYLQQATGGNHAMPIVTYCQSRECWMSYNAALRAIALGYSNVLWYRGGMQAWTLAGRPLESGPAAPLPAQTGSPQSGQQPPATPADDSLWSKLMKPIGGFGN